MVRTGLSFSFGPDEMIGQCLQRSWTYGCDVQREGSVGPLSSVRTGIRMPRTMKGLTSVGCSIVVCLFHATTWRRLIDVVGSGSMAGGDGYGPRDGEMNLCKRNLKVASPQAHEFSRSPNCKAVDGHSRVMAAPVAVLDNGVHDGGILDGQARPMGEHSREPATTPGRHTKPKVLSKRSLSKGSCETRFSRYRR